MTLEDYRRVFADGPVGRWDTYGEGSISPMDSAIALCADETGWVGGLGLDAMGGSGVEIEWRVEKPGSIEALRKDGGAWRSFSFEFLEADGQIVLALGFGDDLEENQEAEPEEWMADFTFDRRKYRGRCESAG